MSLLEVGSWFNVVSFSHPTEKQGPERKRIKKEPTNTRKSGLPFGMGMPGIRAGYPLSERQQVALLMQMTAEESVHSPGAYLSWAPRLGGHKRKGTQSVASTSVMLHLSTHQRT